MAYTACSANVARNIAINCDAPIVAGYTGRGVLLQLDEAPTFTVDSTNPRIITAISLASGKKSIVVANVFTDPFTGSNTASSTDDGRATYTKTFAFRIPQRGAATSKELVEPLMNNALGFVAILEKKDRNGDGSFEVIGYQQGLKVNGDGISRDESANGGDISVTMSCKEPYFETVLFATASGESSPSYAATLAAFETLISSSY